MTKFATHGDPIAVDFRLDFGRRYLDVCWACAVHPQEYFVGERR